MSVYTELNQADVVAILDGYAIGELVTCEGIAAGIENSNFFVTTNQGRFVLTVFERMDEEELPYFMRLMMHLSHHGVSCPDVMVRNDGSLLFDVASGEGSKKGCVVSCLGGRTLDELSLTQLESSGRALAGLHLAGADFAESRDNPTGIAWLSDTILGMLPDVDARYGESAAGLLHDELVFQQSQDVDLPSGVIHGDLFVDNILFDGDAVSGIIDFYYAHDSAYVMDIAISLNAQAILLGGEDTARMQAFLDGYESVRALHSAEKAALPGLLRLAALRFWTSRLFDALYPRGGAMTQTKDPEEYRQKLLLHRAAA